MPGEPSGETPTIGACRGCGYPLRGLASMRCPECGREFDPADPKSMWFGREPGFLARMLMRRLPWPLTLFLGFAATAAIAIASRPQVGDIADWELSPADLPFYGHQALRHPSLLVNWTDGIYASAIWVWMFLLLVFLWTGFGALLSLRYDATRVRRRNQLRRFLLATLLLVISGECVVVGWPYRAARHVAVLYIGDARQADGHIPLASVKPRYPIDVYGTHASRRKRILRSAIVQGPTPQERIAGLAMAQADLLKPSAGDLIAEGFQRETDPAVREWEVRLLAIHRDPQLRQVIDGLLASPDPRLQLAALDAILQWEYGDLWGDAALTSSPKIPCPSGMTFQLLLNSSNSSPRSPPSLASTAVLGRVRDLMASTDDEGTRETAAHVLFDQQDSSVFRSPQPSFRVAEWGVWIDQRQMANANAVVDDIPPFVHHFSDTAASLETWSLLHPIDVNKPVIHFYTDRPMVVGVQTQINRGRIDYVFPMPDSYLVSEEFRMQPGTQPGDVPLAAFDPKGGVPFPKHPPSRQAWAEDPASPSPFSTLPAWPVTPRLVSSRAPNIASSSIGFTWNRLVLLPQQQPWMKPPAVPADAKYAWWPRLRQVPSAWVCNRGECERFLYYDGPSLNLPPVRVRMPDAGHLWLDAPVVSPPGTSGGQLQQTARADRRDERLGMYIQVMPDGSCRGEAVNTSLGADAPLQLAYTLGSSTQFSRDELQKILRNWIVNAGLTPQETDGMLAAWHETFFVKPGRRFVLLMCAADYDILCPITITPRPQTLARVGLVWTELTPGAWEQKPQ